MNLAAGLELALPAAIGGIRTGGSEGVLPRRPEACHIAMSCQRDVPKSRGRAAAGTAVGGHVLLQVFVWSIRDLGARSVARGRGHLIGREGTHDP
jgi:hypothetical protein